MTNDELDRRLAGLDLYAASPAAIAGVVDAAMKAGQRALAFRVPTSVDLSQRDSLPLLALEASRTDQSYGVARRGVIVVTRVQGNHTEAASWFTPKPAPRRKPRPADDDDEGEGAVGFRALTIDVDLRERFPDLLWRPSTLLVRVITGEEISAPARVELTAGALGDDPDVRTFVEWARANENPLAVATPDLPMDDQRDEWTPAVPDSPGVALALQPVSLARASDRLLLRGAYRLPLRAGELVTPGSPNAFDAEGAPVVARLQIALVLVGERNPAPTVIVLPIAARALSGELVDGRPCAVGQFRCDLFGHPAMPRGLQRYALFAFSGEHAAGPVRLTLISETLVPPREDYG